MELGALTLAILKVEANLLVLEADRLALRPRAKASLAHVMSGLALPVLLGNHLKEVDVPPEGQKLVGLLPETKGDRKPPVVCHAALKKRFSRLDRMSDVLPKEEHHNDQHPALK